MILKIEWATRDLHDLPLAADRNDDFSHLPIPGLPAKDRTDSLPITPAR